MINLVLKKYREFFNIKPKANVYFIGGGEVFEKHDDYITWLKELKIRKSEKSWKGWVIEKLFFENIQSTKIQMPCSWNAHYNEWEIWFEKYTSKMGSHTHLVGHSLGGIFLAKYTSKNPEFFKKIKSIHLVAAPFNYCFDFNLKKSEVVNSPKIFSYQSMDDEIVRTKDSLYSIFSKTKNNSVKMYEFEDRGHFLNPTFIELFENINSFYQ